MLSEEHNGERKRFWRRRFWMSISEIAGVCIILLAIVVSLQNRSSPVVAAVGADWPTYLADQNHSGYNAAESIINPTTAPSLKPLWTAQAGGTISTQVVEANGLIYWGSWDGNEHASNLSGGSVWTTNLGKTVSPNPACLPNNVGVGSTASVVSVSINGTMTSVVYVGGGNGQFYALNATTGAVIWQTALGSSPDHYLWSSPTVYNGSIYMGISSFGDCPLVQGQLVQLNASTGAIQHTFDVVPAGCIGGSVWSSPVVDQGAGTVYISTGNGGKCSAAEPYGLALIQLRASDLTVLSSWQVPKSAAPGDTDFGASPMLFQATIGGVSHALVGVVCKNGIYYAFDRTAISNGPVWQAQIAAGGNDPLAGEGSVSSSSWDGSNLYVAGGDTTIGGSSCRGSLRALDPATGAFRWERCLMNGPVLGAVSAVPGVAAVGEGNTLVLVATASGQPLYTYTDSKQGSSFYGSPSFSHGILYIGNADGSLYAFGLPGSFPSPTPDPTATVPPPTLPPGPVHQSWYFAEGKVGQGFTEFLTIQNPDPLNACTVSIQYLLSNSTPAPKVITVAPDTRWTEGVNGDLGVAASSSGYQAVSTILSVSNTTICKGVVAERPIYFTNFKGVSSGTDALGATGLGTNFYFADVSTLVGYNSYITILNPPGGASATITATYYLGGAIQGSDTLVVAPGTRGTILPKGLGARSAAWVHASAPVVVERPTYFANYTAGNAQLVSGAATVVGAPGPASDWRFAEGYVGSGFQENLVLANFGSSVANATVMLEYDNGSTLTNTYPIKGQDSITVDVNAATVNHLGVCLPATCVLSQSVSAEITTNAGTNIVAEREMFFHFNHFDRALNRTTTATGGTDVVGQSGAAVASAYSFAEGYTYAGYDEWLTVQNPTAKQETVWVTLSNGKGTAYEFALLVPAHSRYTVNVDEPVVLRMFHSGDGTAGYQVSLTVQTTDKSVFVAERPLYWNAGGTQGGDDVLGYLGG
jgi:polyvinyl alcohol dehydrogenase (cytochrome)